MAKVPEGVRSTLDAVVEEKAPPQPKRKKKAPALSRKERADRRQAIKVRLEEINNEGLKHDESLKKAVTERVRLVKNLQDKEKRQKAKVNDMLDEHFESASAGKLMDKILQSEMVEPQLQQLRGNITKLDNQIAWHRGKLRGLSAERDALGKEQQGLDLHDIAEKSLNLVRVLIHDSKKLEGEFQELKGLVLEGRSMDPNWLQPLERVFNETEILSLSDIISECSSFGEYVRRMEELGGVYSKTNPLHRDYAERDHKPYKDLPLQRPGFGVHDRGSMALGVKR